MDKIETLFDDLRKTADGCSVEAIAHLIREGDDRQLCRINVLTFAATSGINPEKAIGAFLHAARLGLFDLSWTMICPGCAGVMDEGATLKQLNKDEYCCSLCASVHDQPTLDETVEVTFTVNPRVRKIAAHDPDSLPALEYFRQVYWTSAIDLPEHLDQQSDSFAIKYVEVPPGEKANFIIELPSGFIIVFDPVTHGTQFIEVDDNTAGTPQSLSVVFSMMSADKETARLSSGTVELTFENQSNRRILPAVWRANHAQHETLHRRRPFLSAKRLLTNQTFRDIYRTDTMDVGQRLSITSLTFLFTDLKGSTQLYERVGDLAAYDLVRQHFSVLNKIVASEAGAVVKTIGDAVMATFPAPAQALRAALSMREAMHRINTERGSEDLLLKIGIHEGPCLAVISNDRQDYFGQTVNMAARVQGIAVANTIFVTKQIISDAAVGNILQERRLNPIERETALRGIASITLVYEIQ
ncbi:MAG: adenylate/guanylate cyclase domain-containing protein [Xanthobacteraceae bacterium]|nr:adenylate/guanylate cyclase domain-containing protein [Xanthobacteraceae bacterium]